MGRNHLTFPPQPRHRAIIFLLFGEGPALLGNAPRVKRAVPINPLDFGPYCRFHEGQRTFARLAIDIGLPAVAHQLKRVKTFQGCLPCSLGASKAQYISDVKPVRTKRSIV